MQVSSVIQIGTFSARPAANTVAIGTLFCATDTGVVYRSNGATWDPFPGAAGGTGILDAIEFVIDGGGSAITTGVKGDLEIPFSCTINRATLLADQTGSIVVDVWKKAYASYPPGSGDKITASAPPTISSSNKSQDSTLTGWTTTINAGDTLRFNVNSVATITRVALSLKITRS